MWKLLDLLHVVRHHYCSGVETTGNDQISSNTSAVRLGFGGEKKRLASYRLLLDKLLNVLVC